MFDVGSLDGTPRGDALALLMSGKPYTTTAREGRNPGL
jgi:hypothetical protein